MKKLSILMLAALSTAAFADTVTVTVNRVRQIDDLDKTIFGITKDRADFYCQIWINGKMYQSKNMSSDDGFPGWEFSVPVNTNLANIRIKLVEDDGGLEKKDDFVDINPMNDKKDLHFTLNQRTGSIYGDVMGTRGQTIRSTGKFDSSQGEIWFTVK